MQKKGRGRFPGFGRSSSFLGGSTLDLFREQLPKKEAGAIFLGIFFSECHGHKIYFLVVNVSIFVLFLDAISASFPISCYPREESISKRMFRSTPTGIERWITFLRTFATSHKFGKESTHDHRPILASPASSREGPNL